MIKVADIYLGENVRTESEELRIVLEDGRDLFFGAGLNEDGEPLSTEEVEETLKADKNWRDRVRVIQRESETTGTAYEMAVLSSVVKKRSLEV
tara:strand:- start:345 stop:623 length:279 start_codon:yes stop_codon:yes gene_type:complete